MMKNFACQSLRGRCAGRGGAGDAGRRVGRRAGIAAAMAFGALATVGLASVALAQDAGNKRHTPTADGLKVAREFLDVTAKAQRFDQIVLLLTQQITAAFKRRNPGKDREIDSYMDDLAKRFLARQAEMINLVAPLYAERFSIAEMREVMAFYKTPVGQRILTEMPDLMQQSMRLGMQWGSRIGQEIAEEARRDLAKQGIRL